MNPEFLDRSIDVHQSYSVTDYRDQHFIDVWHYHEQFEVVATLKSRGTRFVGDSIERFKPGQIVVLGGNLPHMWKNDREYFEPQTGLQAHAVTIHLGKKFIAAATPGIPEMANINRLLAASRRGILVQKHNEAFQKMKVLPTLQGFERFLAVMEILNLLGRLDNHQLLASEGFVMNIDNTGGGLQKIHQYVMNQFKTEIELEEAAGLVHMNPSSFSRFFSDKYGKPFVRYVNDIRIGYARKLLIESRLNITEICFESGFRNISNFNRQFKKSNDRTPTEFRKQYKREE